jgi:hypothetical protein
MIINAGVHCYDGRNTAAQWQPAMWPTFLRLLVGPAAANLNFKVEVLRARPGAD